MTHILLGGSGRLGKHFLATYSDWLAPSHEEIDITDKHAVARYFTVHKPQVVIHAAAVVGRNEAASDRQLAIQVNVEGTANIAKACLRFGARLVYISSVAVFDGKKGEYTEEDTPNPVYFYGWTKYAGEQAVGMLDNAVIVRTDFFVPGASKYTAAFTDHFCSKMPVRSLITALAVIANSSYTGVLHVGLRRDTLYNMLLPYNSDLRGITIAESSMPDFPKDLSLNIARFESFIQLY